ncbi:MAG: hypothetical protein ACJAYG_001607 [Oceanicoccus sp.]|jgi:hypothetical protein
MVYTVLAGVVVVVAFLVVLVSARLLFKGSWFLGWLRGMTGLLFLSAALLLTFSALDFYSYKQLSKEQAIATISFTKLDSQQFQASLVDSDGVEQRYKLAGDLWQLDARIIKWHKSLAGIGLTPGYRLDRLSGRYYSLQEEKSSPRTVHQLGRGHSQLDIWQFLHDNLRDDSVVDASYGSATYLPMEDGALFTVTLSSTGLLARPLNERAKIAIERWE